MAEAKGVAKEQLRKFIERIERLEEEMKNLRTDIKEVFDEAKISGFDVPALKQVLKMKKIDPEKREMQEVMVRTYFDAIQ
ncbi:MAG: DUF2312 domain-containing protein [Rickettsiales bacterium]|jgi:uncharacterized protein (UPF0335 family)|nr:DUF2312 domain-containing protein [Rickettsiales bacterium]